MQADATRFRESKVHGGSPWIRGRVRAGCPAAGAAPGGGPLRRGGSRRRRGSGSLATPGDDGRRRALGEPRRQHQVAARRRGLDRRSRAGRGSRLRRPRSGRRAPSRARAVRPLLRQEGPLAGERHIAVDRAGRPAPRSRAAARRSPAARDGPPGGGAAGVVEHPVAVERAGGGPPGRQAALQRGQVGSDRVLVVAVGVCHGGFEPLVQPGEPGLVSAMGGGQRAALEPGGLLEGQAAPDPGDDDLAGLGVQLVQEPGGVRGVDPVVGGVEPRPRRGRTPDRRPAARDAVAVRDRRAAAIAPLRTTRYSQATARSGAGSCRASATNASCTTSSGASHHGRAKSTSAAACSSNRRPRISGPIRPMGLPPCSGFAVY